MPIAAPRACRHNGCRAVVSGRSGFCEEHRRADYRAQKQTVDVDYVERNRFYQRAPWKRARLDQLSREPLCAEHARLGLVVAAEVVDHIVPIEDGGDEYASANLQSLCKSCHNAKTRRDVSRKISTR